jgi:ElaB/YqjD/DUF883 family membrane-anchored ribosome-binding protein
MRFLFLVLATACVSACGLADVGTTAATVGKVQADQARQAQQDVDAAKAKIEAAMKVEEQRLREADGNARN